MGIAHTWSPITGTCMSWYHVDINYKEVSTCQERMTVSGVYGGGNMRVGSRDAIL